MDTTTYDQLRTDRPDLFHNEPDGIQILPTTPGHGVIYQDRWITLLRDRVQFPDGATGSYNRLLSTTPTPGCVILPILGDQIILIEHYRHSTRRWHLEIPRGCGAPTQTREETAIRELAEEIGGTAEQLWDLGSVHPDTGILGGDPVGLFAAQVSSVGEIDGHEGIRRMIRVSVGEVEQMVIRGEVTDGFTLAALYRARLFGVLPDGGRDGS